MFFMENGKIKFLVEKKFKQNAICSIHKFVLLLHKINALWKQVLTTKRSSFLSPK